MDDEEIPKHEHATYLLEQGKYEIKEDQRVIFCVDQSGSMCVTSLVAGVEQSTSFSADVQNGYVSRLQSLKQAIKTHLGKLYLQKNKTKVGLVSFNDNVTIYGDGLQEPEVLLGEFLLEFDVLVSNGEEYGENLLKEPIEKSLQGLTSRLASLEESGPTALGPAIVFSIAMAGKGEKGSQIIVCTDGLANTGLG